MEKSSFLKINPADSVVVCLEPIAAGTTINVDGKDITPAKIVYYGKYYINGDDGKKYKTLRLSYMEKEKGKYKEIARFYVTDDSNHIPVRLDMYLRFGSAKAYITQMKGNRSPVKTY